MFRPRLQPLRAVISRRYASTSGPNSLLLIEYRGGEIDSGTLSALTAATSLGGQVTGLIVGNSEEVDGVVEKASKSV